MEDGRPNVGVWAPRRGVLGGALAVAAAIVLATLATGRTFPWILGGFAVSAAVALAGIWGRRNLRAPFPGRVELSREGVRLGRRLAIPRSSIMSAHLQRQEDDWFVHVFHRDGSCVTLWVPDRDDGREAIDALELDAGSATAGFLMLRRSYSKVSLTLPFLLWVVPTLAVPWIHGLAIPLAALATLLGFAVTATRMRQVTVGADGIRVRDAFVLSPRFIPHDAIEDVQREASDVVLRLRGGDEVRLSMGFATSTEETEGTAQALVDRIREARAVFHASEGRAPALGALTRGERSTREWLDALRRAGEEAEGGFRDAVAGRARLWELVTSGQTPARARVAAAVALRVAAEADDDTRVRIAAIAESCAESEVAERMRVAAEGEDEDLEALLEKVEPKGKRTNSEG